MPIRPNRDHRPLVHLLTLCGLAGAPAALGQNRFVPIGTPSSEPDAATLALGVSADGQTVVGYYTPPNNRHRAFRWVEASGFEVFPTLSGGSITQAWNVSADGMVVPGRSNTSSVNAFRGVSFNTGATPTQLPFTGVGSWALGVSANGSRIVGHDGAVNPSEGAGTPIVWVNGVRNALPLHPSGGWTRASATTNDGAIIAGYQWTPGTTFARYHSLVWTNGATPVYLPTVTGTPGTNTTSSVVDAMSSDGRFMVGTCHSTRSTNTSFVGEACMWTDGVPQGLGDLPGGGFYSRGLGVALDGSVVVGYAEVAVGPQILNAFMWDPANGMRRLQDVLDELPGIDLTGWTLTAAQSITADGRHVVGYGVNPLGVTEGWVAHVECLAEPFIQGASPGATICPGSAAMFEVQAIGASISYQWRLDGVPLTDGPLGSGAVAGATTSQVSLTGLAFGQGGVLDSVVSNACGSQTTTPALVDVRHPADITTTAVPGSPGYGTPNGALNNDDFFYYLTQFAAGNLGVCDLTATAVPGSPGYGVPNGILNNDDFFFYLSVFAAGCP